MKTRTLGRAGPTVSAIGLGCMGMSEFYGPSDDAASERLIHEAVARGVTLFDTADMYGVGANEILVGRALRAVRERVLIASKFGNMRRIDGAMLGQNGRPEYVRAACEQSLRRLGTDRIDLYYLHRLDPQVPIEDTVGAMADLVAAGKVRWLGLCEVGAQTLRRAHATHPITALQTEMSLWTRDAFGPILDTVRELGMGFVAYSPLGRGFLTGALARHADFAEDDTRARSPRMSAGNFERNRALVRRIEAMALGKGVSAAQLALAWVLAQGEDIVPIPGTRRERYLLDNIGATGIALSPEERDELAALLPQEAVAGTRYDAQRLRQLGL